MRSRWSRLAALGLLFCGVTGATAEPTALTWTHEGYASLLTAAAEAKPHGKRLLLGLSGSPT